MWVSEPDISRSLALSPSLPLSLSLFLSLSLSLPSLSLFLSRSLSPSLALFPSLSLTDSKASLMLSNAKVRAPCLSLSSLNLLALRVLKYKKCAVVNHARDAEARAKAMARQAGSPQFTDFTTGFTSTKRRGPRQWHVRIFCQHFFWLYSSKASKYIYKEKCGRSSARILALQS